jgi:hypothetical protein
LAPRDTSTSNTPAQTLEAVGGTFARGGPSTPYGNLQEDTMSDQTDLIRGTLDLLTMRTIALEPRLSARVDLVL